MSAVFVSLEIRASRKQVRWTSSNSLSVTCTGVMMLLVWGNVLR